MPKDKDAKGGAAGGRPGSDSAGPPDTDPGTPDKVRVALQRWRAAEREYAAEAATFLDGDGPAPALSKDRLIALVTLRERADRWREKYFKRASR